MCSVRLHHPVLPPSPLVSHVFFRSFVAQSRALGSIRTVQEPARPGRVEVSDLLDLFSIRCWFSTARDMNVESLIMTHILVSSCISYNGKQVFCHI